MTIMSLSRRYRDQPVEAVSRTPRSTAYACFTEEGYTVARDAFHSKFLSLTSEVGPWAPDSLTSLYNYLIAAIKLFNYGEAEEQCRYILGLMETLNMGQENCFICLECILDTSYFLSGKLDDAARHRDVQPERRQRRIGGKLRADGRQQRRVAPAAARRHQRHEQNGGGAPRKWSVSLTSSL